MNKTINALILGAWLLATVAVLSGCSQRKSQAMPKPAIGTTLFDSANPEIKGQWDKIVAAYGTNDYATVIISCFKLLPNNALTPEQRAALKNTMTAENGQMMEAIKKGDPAAIKANEEVNKQWR